MTSKNKKKTALLKDVHVCRPETRPKMQDFGRMSTSHR